MRETEILKRIYPSIVTWGADWRQAIEDIKNLKLKEVALFLTGVNQSERQEIYRLLQRTSVKRIPHVHAKGEMSSSEFEFLIKHYKTRAFTIHYQYWQKFRKTKFRKKLFIEINDGDHRIRKIDNLKYFGGVCIDLSHYAEFKLSNPREFKVAQAAVQRYKVGCNHLSGLLARGKSWHRVKTKKELDYVVEIPKKYFSRYICLELQNSIREQLVFKKYLAKVLSKAWNRK